MIRILLLFFLVSIVTTYASSSSNRPDEGNNAVNARNYRHDTALINEIVRKVSTSQTKNTDSLLLEIRNANNLAVSINYHQGIAETKFLQGELLYRMNNYKTALECFTDARLIAEESSNYLLQAKCLEQMGSVNLAIGDDHLALKLYYESLPLFELTGNKEGIAKVYNIIGVSRSSQGEYDSAICYFAKARKINVEIGNQSGVIHNDGNLAFMYYNMGYTDKAKETYLALIPSLIETDDYLNLSVIYYHLSIFAETSQQPDSVVYYLRKALKISEKVADTSLLTTLYGRIGEIHLQNHRYDSARIYLNQSYKTAKAINDYITMKQSLNLLIASDTLTGHYRQAISKCAFMLIAADSIYSQKLRNNLDATQLKYEIQKKAGLIEIQNINLKLASRQKLLLLTLFSSSLVIIILLIVILFLLKRNHKKKHELLAEKLMINDLQLKSVLQTEEINKLKIENAEKEIAVKENELVSNALALEQKNELLGLINNKINEAMLGEAILSIKDLNGIVSAIKVQINEKDLFNQKFSQLHSSFFDTLKTSYPALTKSELKFCAYLKLHLDSNQIASIMNVTTEAIRKTRYRIRKKMGLGQSDSLEDCISRF